MSTQGSPLASVLKKSLSMKSHYGEILTWDWNAAAKALRDEYDNWSSCMIRSRRW
jgi:hypothetical protein